MFDEFLHDAPVDREPFWDWSDCGLVVVASPLCFLMALVATQTINTLAGHALGDAARVLIFQLLLYLALFGALAFLVQIRHDRGVWAALRWETGKREVLPLLVGGCALAFLAALLGVALRAPQIDNAVVRLFKDPYSTAAVGVFACTLGPAAEEAFFRGFLQPLVRRHAPVWVAIVGISIVFALLHGSQYAWSWKHLLMVAAASCGFGYARERWNSTGASTLVHAGYNLTFFLGYLLQGRALPTHG
jgi:membrane protease YdiL (CAAX protease family)